MPGGKMAVYTGLIDRIKPSDAELAAVIGHEMAHALREHSREQVSQQMVTNMGLSVLSAVTGAGATADLGNALSEVMFTLPNRSEEHTSELQSLMRISYAVFCLKKKKTTHKDINNRT